MIPLQKAQELWQEPEALIEMWSKDDHKIRQEKIIADLIGQAGYVVDLGCGVGRFSRVLKFKKYQGYDQSSQMIQSAKIANDLRSNAKALRTEFACVNIFQFLSDESYDTAIMIDVAHHQENPLEAVALMLKLWKAKNYFFTLLIENKAELLYNSVITARAEFEQFCKDHNIEVVYREQHEFEWVVCKKCV